MPGILGETIASATVANSRPIARQASPHSGFDTPRSCRGQSAASTSPAQWGWVAPNRAPALAPAASPIPVILRYLGQRPTRLHALVQYPHDLDQTRNNRSVIEYMDRASHSARRIGTSRVPEMKAADRRAQFVATARLGTLRLGRNFAHRRSEECRISALAVRSPVPLDSLRERRSGLPPPAARGESSASLTEGARPVERPSRRYIRRDRTRRFR